MDKLLHLLSERRAPYDDLFYFIQEAAVIGTWEFFLENEKLLWSLVTKKIHEVSLDFEPNVDTGLKFYKEGTNLEIITNRFKRAIEHGENFDEELQILTAKGNEKWVRSIGYPVFEKGKCIKVFGLFQDITDKTNAARKIAIREEQFRASFNRAAAAMSIIDLDGKWTKVNNAMINNAWL